VTRPAVPDEPIRLRLKVQPSTPRPAIPDSRFLYLDLMQKCLLNTIYEDPAQDPWSAERFDPDKRAAGLDWPSLAHTMIGQKRLDNLRQVVETVLVDEVPGDLIETGVWRGGACILMRAVLKAYGVADRRVFVADSFEGLPPPDPAKYPADAGDQHYTFAQLAVSMEQVQANFAKYDLLDDQVVFLKGWFRDTLAQAPIEKLAVLRLDGDMYESTMDSLTALYDKVSPGGFIIVDDFALPGCNQAIGDFRRARHIDDPLVPIDPIGRYWQKSGRVLTGSR
jgi:Macrocin-O-methyltransferase (TylF)